MRLIFFVARFVFPLLRRQSGPKSVSTTLELRNLEVLQKLVLYDRLIAASIGRGFCTVRNSIVRVRLYHILNS
jgi:hypothetical protein